VTEEGNKYLEFNKKIVIAIHKSRDFDRLLGYYPNDKAIRKSFLDFIEEISEDEEFFQYLTGEKTLDKMKDWGVFKKAVADLSGIPREYLE
jgi:hypothetical protein